MKNLFDETYTSEDGKRASRNIWHGDVDIYVDGAYGKVVGLNEGLMDNLLGIIAGDLAKDGTGAATETNWYFYGSDVTREDIGDHSRSTIMVRERAGEFIAHFNISDQDFALNIDAILAFKAELERRLGGCRG